MDFPDFITNFVEEQIEKQKQSRLNLLEPKIELMEPPYGVDEILETLDSLISTNVTMGEKVRKFEQMWAEYIGVNYGVMVNSGSSANLLALSVLSSHRTKNRIEKGSEIITPALTWSTTVYPIINIGAIPKLVDVNKEEFIVDVETIKEAITDKTKAIMPVHLLGFPVDMNAIMDLAEDHNLWVVEDSCEAHGAKIRDRMIGSFGHLSTFSFFFSHHITTIEGGMVLTDDRELANNLKSYRAHGWIRERDDKQNLMTKYQGIDERFLFYTKGYNFRPTEIQGGFGIHQIKKLERFLEKRANISRKWSMFLMNFQDYFIIPKEKENCRNAWFGFPLLIKQNDLFSLQDLKDFLEKNNISTRPIMGGNIARQPAMINETYVIHKTTENADYIMENGLFIGNHQNLRERDINHFCDVITKFFNSISR